MLELLPWVYTLLEVAAIIAAFHAIQSSRTSQGAIAWSLSLVTIPFLSLPLYILIGRSQFIGHINLRRMLHLEVKGDLSSLKENIRPFIVDNDEDELQALADLPWLKGNKTKLLIDGVQTYEALFRAIDEAKHYIFIQFFIVEEDDLAYKMADALERAHKRGVKILFIYDAIGSYHVPEAYWQGLRHRGVEVYPFDVTERKTKRLQLNFRNHRKICTIDGQKGFLGGLNLGETYLGKKPKLSPWRDTHLLVEGPSVVALQICFLEDWFFVKPEAKKEKLIELFKREISSYRDEGDGEVLILPSGPSDPFESCGLMMVNLFNKAKKRLWLASPYFIPDGKVKSALVLAALRGVDVRILLPQRPDHLMVFYARRAFYQELQAAGVKFYLYKEGFLHQKVSLVDHSMAMVSTANLDNRSFRLNFEVSALMTGQSIIKDVEDMLINDFNCSELLDTYFLDQRPLGEQIVVRLCRLFSPLL